MGRLIHRIECRRVGGSGESRYFRSQGKNPSANVEVGLSAATHKRPRTVLPWPTWALSA